MFKVVELRCEYQNNPIGIGVTRPRISWQLHSDERATSQSSYQIEIASEGSFAAVIWESGEVASSQSVHVELDSFIAESCKRYYYRVRVRNQSGALSEWSETAFWEMGILTSSEWIGDWISAPLQLLPVTSETNPMLRKQFVLKGTVKEARLYATALGLYELELNGERVGDRYFTPGWTSYSHTLQTQTYDITKFLQAGENVVGSLLGNGWYKGNLAWSDNKCIYGDRLALLVQMHIEYEDGGFETIVSDETWKAALSPILMSELYHGETYDARLEKRGWSTALYDDKDWVPAQAIDQSKDILKPQINEPVRKKEHLKPVALITTPKGETVIDFGQNMVGWVQFSVQGDAGTEVTLLHAEVLDQEGNFYIDNLRSAKQAIKYVLKGDDKETFEPRFTFQGFRYVQVIGFQEPLTLSDFTGIVLHSDMAETGTFECSDPLVNQLQHNIKWGLKGNFLDVPTDCPQRDERLGWTGDAQMFIQTASYLSNVAPFFTKWLRDVESDQREDGGVPFVIPHVLGEKDHSSAAWGDAAVICPWTLYVCYGDKRILEEQYESMKAWVSYIRSQGDNEFLWNTGFHFGDWLGLDAKSGDYVGATDRDFIATAFYAYSVSIMEKTAAVLNKQEDAEAYGELFKKVRSAFQEEFVTASGRLAVPTQTSHVLALMFGLLDSTAEKRAALKLHELIEQSQFHLTTGFVGTPYLNHVLSQNGLNDDAYKLLLQQTYPSWLYPVTKGATTIWEHWDGIKEDGSFWDVNMNSFNHYAYGAIGDWMYRTVAGIQTVEEAPGYKQILIAPQLGEGLTWAEGQLETLYGMVSSKWIKSENGTMSLAVTVPPNTTAEIHLPGAAASSEVTESGVALNEIEGLTGLVAKINGDIKLTIGSGSYHFTY